MSQNFLAFSIIPEAVAHELCARAARELAASAPTSTRELCDHFQPTPAVVEIMTIVRQVRSRLISLPQTTRPQYRQTEAWCRHGPPKKTSSSSGRYIESRTKSIGLPRYFTPDKAISLTLVPSALAPAD
ncbi:hypothetical protein AC578_2990 [Pseudocercospora eumusae]|uniref:Uncharacterized protein n=1 Tax=Pseudocercospora eumusae TaxID=321146 RepID=A0A139GX84_9PEZI|nr:hypothetical protein AC578_2990 [Pseudocercospora eumusae]